MSKLVPGIGGSSLCPNLLRKVLEDLDGGVDC